MANLRTCGPVFGLKKRKPTAATSSKSTISAAATAAHLLAAHPLAALLGGLGRGLDLLAELVVVPELGDDLRWFFA